MEVGELVSEFTGSVAQDEECPKDKPADPGWKARINEWGSDPKKCSGTELYKFMKMDKDNDSPGFLRGLKPFVAKPGTSGYAWKLDACSREHFPIQAHHLIPKNHLPSHGVCAFLAKKYSKNPAYKLASDTDYNTDHSFNGYCLPYATPLAEWKGAGSDDDKKLDLVGRVMDRTGRQLHQGSHRAAPYEDPQEAEEEDNIHRNDKLGYLDRVSSLLDVIMDAAITHAMVCGVCKEKKKDLPPRERVVTHMHQVSGIVKLLVDANRIFVSEASFIHLRKHSLDIPRPDWL